MVSLNLRELLKRGGLCFRVEYAKAARHELSRTSLACVAFAEGALDTVIGGKLPAQWFRVAASSLFRSHVMEDVYHQTGDKEDRRGGYVITVLRAI